MNKHKKEKEATHTIILYTSAFDSEELNFWPGKILGLRLLSQSKEKEQYIAQIPYDYFKIEH